MEEQYQGRFRRQRLDSIGLDTATKEFLAIEFKRTQDTRSNYVERATEVAQVQYRSLLTGFQAVGQVKGWKVEEIVFVGVACGSRERVLFIGTQFSILYTSMCSPAEAATQPMTMLSFGKYSSVVAEFR